MRSEVPISEGVLAGTSLQFSGNDLASGFHLDDSGIKKLSPWQQGIIQVGWQEKRRQMRALGIQGLSPCGCDSKCSSVLRS